MKSSNYTRQKNGRTARRGMGITGKLASAIVVSVLLAVAALLIVVYMQMSKELLMKSEEILEATMGETVQATKAWLNRNLTMLEVHLLTDICDLENSTVSSLAAAWGRSVSATSQTVRRLMAKDLVTRENAPENGKVFYLHPTPKGLRVSDEHKRYDTEDTIKTVKRLMKKLGFEEIEIMFKALDCYGELLREVSEKDR